MSDPKNPQKFGESDEAYKSRVAGAGHSHTAPSTKSTKRPEKLPGETDESYERRLKVDYPDPNPPESAIPGRQSVSGPNPNFPDHGHQRPAAATSPAQRMEARRTNESDADFKARVMAAIDGVPGETKAQLSARADAIVASLSQEGKQDRTGYLDQTRGHSPVTLSRDPGESDEDYKKRVDIQHNHPLETVENSTPAPPDPVNTAWRTYRLRQTVQLRPYMKGENMEGIDVNGVRVTKSQSGPGHMDYAGGFIARNDDDHADQWFLSRDYVKDHYYI